MDGVEKARRDLAEGRPWQARDRLRGVLDARPQDPEVFDLLGQTYAAMNDLPAAGAAWFLSHRRSDDPEVAAAIAALRSRYRRLGAVAVNLHVRHCFDSYAPEAQGRLEALRRELLTTGWTWDPPSLPASPLSPRGGSGTSPVNRTWRSRLVQALLFAGILLATVGIWVLGIVALLTWIF